MQSINRVILNPLFLIVFLGTAAACLLVVQISWRRWHEAGAACVLAGALLYLVGTFLVTMPLNTALDEPPVRPVPKALSDGHAT